MSLRNYTAMRVRQAEQELAHPIEKHAFVLDERMQAPLNRIKCKACGKSVTNLKVHERLSQAELDVIAMEPGALWYSKAVTP